MTVRDGVTYVIL